MLSAKEKKEIERVKKDVLWAFYPYMRGEDSYNSTEVEPDADVLGIEDMEKEAKAKEKEGEAQGEHESLNGNEAGNDDEESLDSGDDEGTSFDDIDWTQIYLEEEQVFSSNGNFAVIGYDPDSDRVILSLRGSYNFKNWLYDLDLLKSAYTTYPCASCFVHDGFY